MFQRYISALGGKYQKGRQPDKGMLTQGVISATQEQGFVSCRTQQGKQVLRTDIGEVKLYDKGLLRKFWQIKAGGRGFQSGSLANQD